MKFRLFCKPKHGRGIAGSISLLLLFSVSPRLLAQDLTDTSLTSIIARAYQMLPVDNRAAAELFEKAAAIDPANVMIQRQLGYIYHNQMDLERSLRHFQAAESLAASDTTKLQIAYTLVSLGRAKEARDILKGLEASPDPAIREGAARQIEALPATLVPKNWYGRLYLAPYYDTWWKTWLYYGDARLGYYLDKGKMVSGFGYVNISGDARSKGGLSPAIFTDNAALVGVGLGFHPFAGFQFSTQYGVAYDFIKRQTRPRINGDFRAIALYGAGLYPSLNYHTYPRITLSPLLDVYASAGYYSRYQNFIGYLQARGGSRVLEFRNSAVDFYAKGGLARDSERKFYNNILEGGFGMRLIPNVNWGFYMIVEFNRVYYWDVGTTPNPYSKYYSSFRFYLIFDRNF